MRRELRACWRTCTRERRWRAHLMWSVHKAPICVCTGVWAELGMHVLACAIGRAGGACARVCDGKSRGCMGHVRESRAQGRLGVHLRGSS